MGAEVERAQLLAARAAALTLVAQIDACLVAMSALERCAAGPSACEHPPERRTEAPRMGAPGAWVCACGEQGDE